MSLTARLHIEGHSNEDQGVSVISCDYSFSQSHSQRGYATGQITGGIINITIRGLDDEELFTWMVTSNAIKNGRISFSGITSTGPGRRIEFEDAFLVGYHENFANESDVTIQLVISARVISLFGVNHENHWTQQQEGS